jgi:hypothetical protein
MILRLNHCLLIFASVLGADAYYRSRRCVIWTACRQGKIRDWPTLQKCGSGGVPGPTASLSIVPDREWNMREILPSP